MVKSIAVRHPGDKIEGVEPRSRFYNPLESEYNSNTCSEASTCSKGVTIKVKPSVDGEEFRINNADVVLENLGMITKHRGEEEFILLWRPFE